MPSRPRSATHPPIHTMDTEHRSSRKRAYPDEHTDTHVATSPRKRQVTGPSRSSTTSSTNTSSENTPDPCIVQSPYFSPQKKINDSVRKRRLLAASHSLLNENSHFAKRPTGTASPAEPVSRGRNQQNVVVTTAVISECLVSELSKSKSRKRGPRKVPEPITLEDTSELLVDKSDPTAFEKQVSVKVILGYI